MRVYSYNQKKENREKNCFHEQLWNHRLFTIETKKKIGTGLTLSKQ